MTGMSSTSEGGAFYINNTQMTLELKSPIIIDNSKSDMDGGVFYLE